MKTNIKTIFVLLTLLAGLWGCKQDDSFIPPDVDNLKVVSDRHSIKLTWDKPSDRNIKKILITYDNQTVTLEVPASFDSKEIPDVIANKDYFFKVQTEYRNGSLSKGITIQGRTNYVADLIGNFTFTVHSLYPSQITVYDGYIEKYSTDIYNTKIKIKYSNYYNAISTEVLETGAFVPYYYGYEDFSGGFFTGDSLFFRYIYSGQVLYEYREVIGIRR